MKAWELKIKKDRAKNNTYLVLTDGECWLCNKINGNFIVKTESKVVITEFKKAIKL